jgi:hypothetical protein
MKQCTYQVTQKNEWACPGMLIFVYDGRMIGRQINPNNALTQEFAEDEEDWGEFNPSEYAEVKLVRS